MTDRYVATYGKTRKELENDEMVSRFHENYTHLTQLIQADELDHDINDMRKLDHVMYQQALALDAIGSQMKDNLYAEDGSLRMEDLGAYLRVLKQFSTIYERANMTLARRYMVHRY